MRSRSLAAYSEIGDQSETIERYAYLVKRIAQHLLARLPDSVQQDDLVQAGMIGLLEAVAKYDPSKGASFETYAGIRIRGSMLDEMRRGDWAPRSVHRNSRLVTETIRNLEHREGGTATDRDIARAMNVSLADYHAILRDAANCRLFSYEEVNEGDDPSVLPHFQSDDHGAERLELLESVSEAIKQLSEREQLVMSLYYDEELNLKEIGAVLGVSESRVSQILSQAVGRLRSGIAEWMEDEE